MRRFTVMGFTEAELGFVVAALFAAIAVATLNDRDTYAGEQRDLRAELDQTRAELERKKAELERTKTELEHARSNEAKRSTKVPQCWEKGEQREPIAELVVLGSNLYEIEEDVLAIDGIRHRFATYIERSQSLSCRYVLRARPSSGVDAIDQSNAVWRLRQYFDVDDRPR